MLTMYSWPSMPCVGAWLRYLKLPKNKEDLLVNIAKRPLGTERTSPSITFIVAKFLIFKMFVETVDLQCHEIKILFYRIWYLLINKLN